MFRKIRLWLMALQIRLNEHRIRDIRREMWGGDGHL